MDEMFCPLQSLSCPRWLWTICSGLHVEGALWISFQAILWHFSQSVFFVLLLFWTLIFPRNFPTESWERDAMAVTVNIIGVPAQLFCSDLWSSGSFLISGRTDWTADCKEQNCLLLFLCFLFPWVLSWVITQDRINQGKLHVQSVRYIVSSHLLLEHEILATRFDLQLNGKSYSIFPGPQEW